MWWIWERILIWLQYFCMKVIKMGPMPKHVALIMDGNRRYANKQHITKMEGYIKGFNTLLDTLNYCVDLDITEVTVYAFSIDNFKRKQKEINAIMQLAKEKFSYFLKKKDKLAKNGVRIRVIGNLSIIPEDVHKVMSQLMVATKNNNKVFLNIAFAYTSRDEITNTIKDIVKAVKHSKILLEDINEDLISKCLYISSKPDLLIRTSGETRFSDFLMWQISDTFVYFTLVLWPDFTIWNFMRAILYYQKCYFDLPKVARTQNLEPIVHNERVSTFVKKFHHERQVTIENMCLPNT